MSAVLFVQSSDGTLTRASARAINAAVRAAQVNAPVLTGLVGFADAATIEAWNGLIAAGVEVAETTTATLAPAQKAAQTRRTNRRHARKAARTVSDGTVWTVRDVIAGRCERALVGTAK